MKLFFAFLFGSVLGSFFGVIVDRLPLHQSIIWGRSHCTSCQHLLSAFDLIPLVSQIFRKFKCRYCRAPIPKLYLILEFSCALTFTLAVSHKLTSIQALFTLMSILLSAFDSRDHHFPLSVWLFFTLIFMISFPFHLVYLCWIVLALLADRFSLNIGSGDFLWFFTASFVFDFFHQMLILEIACFLGIGYYLFTKKRNEIPFIPFLTIAYLALLLVPQIL